MEKDSESSVFDKLVKDLSHDERRALLQRLGSKSSQTPDSLKSPEPEPVPDWETVYQSYGLFKKFFLWLRGLFQGKDLPSMVGQQLLDDLGASIEKQATGFFTLRMRMAHAPFYLALKKLFDSFEPFRSLFQTAFGPNKPEFIAFLVGIEWSDVQDQILQDTNCEKIGEANPDRPVKEIKSIVDSNLRNIFESIAPERKKILYNGLKDLYALRNLVWVRDDKLLPPFMLVSIAGAPGNASLSELRDGVTDLCRKLYAFQNPPLPSLLEGLYLFHHREKLQNDEVDIELPLMDFLELVNEAWLAIREFHRNVPIVKLAAWLNNSPSWTPREGEGVEDWFAQYRRFWQSRIDRDFDAFARGRQARLIFSDIHAFLELTEDEFRKNSFYPDLYRGTIPAKGNATLMFLKAFLERVFIPKMNPYLKIVLLEGDFYKRNNRGAFTDAYNFLLQLPDQLASFAKNFSDEGDWGKSIVEIRKNDDEQAVVNDLRGLFLTAGDWVTALLEQAMPVFLNFHEILKGIAKGSTGGKFDSLANLNELGGKANGVFRKEMDMIVRRWEKFLLILKDLAQID